MKRTKLLLLAVFMLLALLPGTALAVEEMQSGFSFYVNPGETVKPDYPDFASKIDPKLTKDDFNITYSTDNSKIHIAEDGTVTVDEDIVMGFFGGVWVTYTPKVPYRGRTVRFTVYADVRNAITDIKTTFDSCVIAMDQQVGCNVEIGHDTVAIMKIEGYDESILDIDIRDYSISYYPNWTVILLPKKTGTTTMDFVFHGGKRKTIEIEVVNPPTGVTMSSDEFTCYVGEPLDVGTQLIGGSGYKTLDIKVQWEYTVYQKSDFFPENDYTFVSDRTGAHYITMTTHNGHRATAVVNVRDRASAVRLEATGIINEGVDRRAIVAYDADGNPIEVELEVTEGKEIASFVNGVLKSTGSGPIVVTAHNPDGTTISGAFEIVPNPNEIILNQTHVQLDVGDTFELVVGFDQGKADYTLDVGAAEYYPPFGLYPVRLEGHTITATAPGISYINVQAGMRYATCVVEVLDGDKAVSINVPELFGIGHTHQLQVTDKTGKVYPAKFRATEHTSSILTITEDGLMTGLAVGPVRIYAELEDGRTLHYDQQVYAVPEWITHEDIEFPENYRNVYIGYANSDVGMISELIVEFEDESIASGDIHGLYLHKPGTTKVTLTAVRGGAQTAFNLTVLPADDRLYIHYKDRIEEEGTMMQVPSGYTVELPPVTDYYGNPVKVQWSITDQAPGMGNPRDFAFLVYGNKLECVWSSGWAEVTATAADGRTIKLGAFGFRLASEIWFNGKDQNTLRVGETLQIHVSPHPDQEPDMRVGDIEWIAEDPSLFDIDMYAPGASDITITGLKPGTTTLRAKQVSGRSVTCTVTVEPVPEIGDVNADGVVEPLDALLVMQRLAYWKVDFRGDDADVNGDDVITAEDALIILRMCADEEAALE